MLMLIHLPCLLLPKGWSFADCQPNEASRRDIISHALASFYSLVYTSTLPLGFTGIVLY